MRARFLGVVPLQLAACLQADTYLCEDNLQCRRPNRSGICTADSFCAYPDEACPAGFRYSEYATDDLAGQCVPPDGLEPTTGADDGGVATLGEGTGGGESGPDLCNDGCDTPPGPCFQDEGTCDPAAGVCEYPPRPAGAACDDGEPCSASSACDGQGACVAQTAVDCNDPPSPCHSPIGECDGGTCTYELQPSGAPCEEGDACTVGDVCDNAGVCVAGAVCPSANPCETGACVDGACTFQPIADGTSCGPDSADRCCAGTCVDISEDDANCGGCGMACASGQGCESVALTPECPEAPANTSGRCTCAGVTAQCPHGQICRTVTPANNRCAPENDADCDGIYIEVLSCPNYCTY